MPGSIIDKRFTKSFKSLDDKERYKRRQHNIIKNVIEKVIQDGCITDFIKGRSVKIPINDELESIQIKYKTKEKVYIGNVKYRVGDTIPKDNPDFFSPGRAGEDEKEFILELTTEEVKNFIFKNLNLPRLHKTELDDMVVTDRVNAGFRRGGLPNNLSIVKSFKNAFIRRKILMEYYENAINDLKGYLNDSFSVHSIAATEAAIMEIKWFEKKLKNIPYMDDLDLRYRKKEIIELPRYKGVLFCMLDTSGSMDEARKQIAKTMFLLLYLFVCDQYTTFEVVFIKHDTKAEVCTENKFFNVGMCGGTSFMSGYTLIAELIESKYCPKLYNIFIAQGSDGENYEFESEECLHILQDKLLPVVNLFLFICCRGSLDENSFIKWLCNIKMKNLSIMNVTTTEECLGKFITEFKRED